MNAKLQAIAACAAENLTAAIRDGEKDILAAIDQQTAEAQVQETAAKFRLGFTITMDWDGDSMTTDLTWSVKHKLTIVRAMPEPDQLPLPGVGPSVTITTGEKEVLLTPATIASALRRVSAKN